MQSVRLWYDLIQRAKAARDRADMQAQKAMSLEEVEKKHMRRVLRDAATTQEAADRLGITRRTLFTKRKKYDLP